MRAGRFDLGCARLSRPGPKGSSDHHRDAQRADGLPRPLERQRIAEALVFRQAGHHEQVRFEVARPSAPAARSRKCRQVPSRRHCVAARLGNRFLGGFVGRNTPQECDGDCGWEPPRSEPVSSPVSLQQAGCERRRAAGVRLCTTDCSLVPYMYVVALEVSGGAEKGGREVATSVCLKITRRRLSDDGSTTRLRAPRCLSFSGTPHVVL
jgi:hypothetical protein